MSTLIPKKLPEYLRQNTKGAITWEAQCWEDVEQKLEITLDTVNFSWQIDEMYNYQVRVSSSSLDPGDQPTILCPRCKRFHRCPTMLEYPSNPYIHQSERCHCGAWIAWLVSLDCKYFPPRPYHREYVPTG